MWSSVTPTLEVHDDRLFAKEFPDRFFECGIAEANMVAIGSGLAASARSRSCPASPRSS